MAAYRLRQVYGPTASITVYEREPVAGGRAHQIDFAGTTVEVGATVLHSTGLWIKALLELTGLEPGRGGVQLDGDDEIFGFWNGQRLTLTTKAAMASLGLGVLRSYGIKSALRVTLATRKLARAWHRIYRLQLDGEVFDSTGQLLDRLGLRHYQERSLAQALREEGARDDFVAEVLAGITRNMYTQGSGLNALAGEVGLAGAGLAGGSLYALAEGNQTLFAKALAKLGVDLRLGTAVDRVEAGSGAVRLTTAGGAEEVFDAVVLATPLELSDIALTVDGRPAPYAARDYQSVHVTLVAGQPSRDYFGLPPESGLPSMVFVADTPEARFCSLGVTGFSPLHQCRIYKFFTVDQPLDDQEVRRVFDQVAEIGRFHWRGAYPVLRPAVEPPPFKLAQGLYYVNGFESAASTLELDAVAAYNTAGLVARDFPAPAGPAVS
jgi:prenylcysteine oxidase/farnesylcysteine lyase